MDDQKEKTEKTEETTKETPEATTEPTPEDVNTLIEKTLAEEEKKRQIRPETKTALGSLILLLSSLLYLWLCSTDDNATSINYLAPVSLIGLPLSIVASLIVARFVTWNENRNKFLLTPTVLLWCISFLPFAIGILPFSKYHNQNQIKRDTIISEAYLQIKVLKDGIEILLPSEHTSENSYLEKVFSIGWEEKNYPWKTTADYCQKGKKIWYETKLPFPDWYRSKLAGNPFSIPFSMMTEEEKKKYESNTDNIVLFFKHAWENYEITKEILLPDPTDPNSL